jgi:hypothetical protein
MKLIRAARRQQRNDDGWIYRRTAIIRNTYPELHTTTIKTWHQWMPRHIGAWRDTGPPRHHIIDKKNKFNWEILFIALDRPDDVRKLLSLELSDAWINEAREVPKAVLDGLTGRVGRYPRRIGDYGCTDPQILMDTNPPDADHWWYVYAERDVSTERNRQMHVEMDEIQAKLREIGVLRADQKIMEFFAQPGGESEHAENLDNLTPGYYLKAKAGKDKEWVRVYIDGEYGFVIDGKPVYPEYRDLIHSAAFDAVQRLPLHIGMDFGLTPAAVFAQQMPNGQWRKHSEVVTDNMGIVRFAEVVRKHIATEYAGFTIGSITGDPAGTARGADERTVYDILSANNIKASPAYTNSILLRIESVRSPMKRLIDGEPGMLVHSTKAPMLRKGYAGGYHYRRLRVNGDEKYKEEPDKNMYSHVCDADQYIMVGAGEAKTLIKKEQSAKRMSTGRSDYSIFG